MVVDQDELEETEIAYQKLYSAVGNTVLINYFGPSKLPTKDDEFDWTLGPGVPTLVKNMMPITPYSVSYRDYQASGGRIAFAILAAAAGVGVATGSEGGFASLIDLKTGDIVWFNVVNAGSGELRNEKRRSDCGQHIVQGPCRKVKAGVPVFYCFDPVACW